MNYEEEKPKLENLMTYCRHGYKLLANLAIFLVIQLFQSGNKKIKKNLNVDFTIVCLSVEDRELYDRILSDTHSYMHLKITQILLLLFLIYSKHKITFYTFA